MGFGNAPDDGVKARARWAARMLEETHGRPVWKRRADPLDELILTVLSQKTSDANSRRAFASLKTRFPTWEDAAVASVDELEDAIRPAGLAPQKAPRILGILREIAARERAYSLHRLEQMPTDEAVRYLTSLHGVGLKTAACVLMFSLGRPVLPVDTHVHRVSLRLGLVPRGSSADQAHHILQRLYPEDERYPVHINMIRHGREVCTARSPRCNACPLLSGCPTGQGAGIT
ncbi:MAG: endonuclease III domain-containing protein [Armatimonadota bacterium]